MTKSATRACTKWVAVTVISVFLMVLGALVSRVYDNSNNSAGIVPLEFEQADREQQIHHQYLYSPYPDLFYRNKDVHNRPRTAAEISYIEQMWWNYDSLSTKSRPFTECEEKYLGYKLNRSGDLTFSKPNSLKLLCKNSELKHDIWHSHIECYNTKFKQSSNICSFKNIYAYIDGDNKLKFKAFCKNGIYNQHIFNAIKRSYNKQYPLYIDIMSGTSTNMNGSELVYSEMNNVWFIDNDNQCAGHVRGNGEGDPEALGNPWHCFGHLEYWYRIAKAQSISTRKYNLTLVMTKYNDHTFGPTVPIYHFYSPFFQNIINSDSIRTNTSKKLYYIKELWIDERSKKGWGGSTIWAGQIDKVKQQFFTDKTCQNNTESRRSHICYDMRKDMMNYYELSDAYSGYDWIKEMKQIQNVNKWDIYGNISDISLIVVVATRFVNGRCRYRCYANMRQVAAAIYAILGTLTFQGQYHLFKNTHIFVGVHGAVYLMASLFMPPQSFNDSTANLKRRVALAMINCMDEGIGNITKALKKYNAFDNTLIVFTSDNGAGIGTGDGVGGENWPLRFVLYFEKHSSMI